MTENEKVLFELLDEYAVALTEREVSTAKSKIKKQLTNMLIDELISQGYKQDKAEAVVDFVTRDRPKDVDYSSVLGKFGGNTIIDKVSGLPLKELYSGYLIYDKYNEEIETIITNGIDLKKQLKENGEYDYNGKGLVGLEDYNGLIYKIDLSKSIVKDFSPLASVYINELDLSNTYGSDFNTMKELNVGTIWLEGNKIDDIGFLEDNTVHTLFLNDNNIIDWTPLLNVEGLAWCWTFDNPIIMPDNKEQFVNKGIQIADSNRYAYSN